MCEKHWIADKTIFVQISDLDLEARIEAWAACRGLEMRAGSGSDLIAFGYVFAIVEREVVGYSFWDAYLDYLRESDDLTPCVVLNASRNEAEEGLSNLQFMPESSLYDLTHFLECLLQESLAEQKREEYVWLEALIRNGGINVCDEFDDIPLISAAGFKSPNIVQKLLDAGADVNFCTSNGVTALMEACCRWREGAAEIVEILLRSGADVNACTSRGETPLMRACNGFKEEAPEIVNILLRAGADIGRVDLNGYSATDYAMNRVVKLTHPGEMLPWITSVPINPMYLATTIFALEGDAVRLANLLSQEMPVRIMNNALVIAVWAGHKECCRVLIKHGADVNGRDVSNQSPLNAACFTLQPSIAQLLIKSGAGIDEVNLSGDNLLFAVCQGDTKNLHIASSIANRRLKLTSLLIRHGVDVNCCGYFGYTPLLQAALSTMEPSFIKFLLKHGADPSVRDDNGETILEKAESIASPELAEIIRKALDNQ